MHFYVNRLDVKGFLCSLSGRTEKLNVAVPANFLRV